MNPKDYAHPTLTDEETLRLLENARDHIEAEADALNHSISRSGEVHGVQYHYDFGWNRPMTLVL